MRTDLANGSGAVLGGSSRRILYLTSPQWQEPSYTLTEDIVLGRNLLECCGILGDKFNVYKGIDQVFSVQVLCDKAAALYATSNCYRRPKRTSEKGSNAGRPTYTQAR